MKEELEFMKWIKSGSQISRGVETSRLHLLFQTKWDSKDITDRHEARLVARGFTQQEDIDCKETYFLFLGKVPLEFQWHQWLIYDLDLHQIDVKTVFLNENVDLHEPAQRF